MADTNRRPIRFAEYVDWPETALPMSKFETEFSEDDDSPFGEDIIDPESRKIPPQFCGKWVPTHALDDGQIVEPLGMHLAIEPNEITDARYTSGLIDEQPVIAVRTVNDRTIWVVSQASSGADEWGYSLFSMMLSQDSLRLYDGESMDVTYHKVGFEPVLGLKASLDLGLR